jgi:threonine/homoserine/homoserine lactone efflux protein
MDRGAPVTMAQVLTFVTVVALGAMSPGPDFAVVLRRAALGGRRPGMAAAAGVAAGVFGWALAAAGGIAALLSVVPAILTVIRIAGAGYLVYLGAKALRGAAAPVETAAAAGRSAFRDGLLCNLLNPKAAVFFVALLPQFLPAHPGPLDAVALSLIAVGITLVWFLTVANLVAALRRILRRPRVRRTIDGVSGAALIGLGARLALHSAT